MIKFQNDTSENKKAQLLEVKQALDLLPNYIPEIKNYEVGINFVENPRAYDLVIVSEFETLEALDTYRVHKEHIKAVEIIAKYKKDIRAVDYEV